MNLELIRTNPDAVKRAAAAKRVSVDIDELIELDQKSRRATEHLDGLRHTLKTVSRQVGAGGEGREQAKALGDEIRVAELEQRNHRGRLDTLLSQVPNILAPEVPEGDDDSDNLEIRRWGTPGRSTFRSGTTWS
ncbi:hypothetical protein ACFQ0T_17835 [Kitasatospora gansuensis]